MNDESPGNKADGYSELVARQADAIERMSKLAAKTEEIEYCKTSLGKQDGKIAQLTLTKDC